MDTEPQNVPSGDVLTRADRIATLPNHRPEGTASNEALPPNQHDAAALMNVSRADQIAELECKLRDLKQQQRDDADRRFLVAVAAIVGGHVFSAADLIAHARVDPELRAALGDLRRPRQVGRRLSRLTGREFDGVRVHIVDRNGAGCIWEIHVTR